MFVPTRFAPKSKSFTFTNLHDPAINAELNKAVTEVAVTPEEVDLDRLDFQPPSGDSGKVTLNGAPMTEVALEQLCKLLRIPSPFRFAISSELLVYNIKKLQKENAHIQTALLRRANGDIAGVVRAPYDEIPNADVLSTFRDKRELKEVRIAEDQMLIVLLFEEKMVASVRGIDNWYVGEYIHNSIIRESGLHFFSGLYRTQCENSYLAPYLGRVRANYSIADHQQRLLRILEVVGARSMNEYGNLGRQVELLPEISLSVKDVAVAWNGLQTILSRDEADTLLGMDEEIRKGILADYAAWKVNAANAKLVRGPVPELPFTSKNAYDTINTITDHGKKVTNQERYQLEKLGGKLLQTFLWN